MAINQEGILILEDEESGTGTRTVQGASRKIIHKVLFLKPHL